MSEQPENFGMPGDGLNIERYGSHIYFSNGIDPDTAFKLKRMLKEIETEKLFHQAQNDTEPTPIKLHISSPGGNVFESFALFDIIIKMRVPVYIYVEGAAMSGATFLVLAGDKRFITRNSFMLIHQVTHYLPPSETHAEIEDLKQNSDVIMRSMKYIYKTKTSMNMKEINDILKKDLYLSSEDCLKLGFVDEII
jgi:ATP-dependent Clp protease, protease subunit